MNIPNLCQKIIRISFYLLFLLVPLILTPWNYELFEYNKMMLTYAITVVIAGAWIVNMISNREIRIAKTPLDIPIALFVGSLLVSSLFSIDPHVSWFGYYSRFNGGMLSVFSYVILYYAFVSNITHVAKLLKVTLISAAIVAIYGIAERLGIDKNLWVQDVQNRVFSTLGQPNWLGAYLVALLPIAMAMALQYSKKRALIIGYWLLVIGYFLVLLFTRSRSALVGFAVADIIFWVMFFKKNLKIFFLIHIAFALIIFFNGSNIGKIDKYFSLPGLLASKGLPLKGSPAPITPPTGPVLEVGGTESGTIRKYVWQGAIAAWQSSTKAYLIGTGTETFAFAFYRFRPAGHNLTSEWDFLYNKAHNEYLNYLATTGLFGLGSYVLLLGTFIVWYVKRQRVKSVEASTHALFAGWVSILVTNFFGFSIVIMQLFLFLFPAIILSSEKKSSYIIPLRITNQLKTLSTGLTLLILLVLLGLISISWYADKLYAAAYRQARSGQYIQAKQNAELAILLNPTEPVYHDEFSNTLAALAVAAFDQKDATRAAELAQRALSENDQGILSSDQNVNFWKSRTKLYYAFSAFDPSFNQAAITALEKAMELSPNDPKIYYNLAILYGRGGANDTAIELLKKAITIKSNYHDAYYALYVFYTEMKKPDLGRAILTDYLQRVDPSDRNFTDILSKP